MFAVIASDGTFAEAYKHEPTGTFSPDVRDAARFPKVEAETFLHRLNVMYRTRTTFRLLPLGNS